MLFGFLLKELIIYTLIDKGREFALRIEYMQKRLRDKYNTRDDKVDVLENRWDQLMANLTSTAIVQKDKVATEMIGKIRQIPSNVRNAALKHYNTKCRELHAIAFLQWRMRFPSTLMYDAEQLEELILARINQVYTIDTHHLEEA